MAARRALEWIRIFESSAGFDLFQRVAKPGTILYMMSDLATAAANSVFH